MTRSLRGLVASAALLGCWACGSTFPTGTQIEDSLERQLASVSGDWVGTSFGGELQLTLRLTQSGTDVSGSGSLKESSTTPAFNITIEGSYVRPTLDLTLTGFQWNGAAASGTFVGDYTTVAGILSTIDFSTGGSMQILLQEVP